MVTIVLRNKTPGKGIFASEIPMRKTKSNPAGFLMTEYAVLGDARPVNIWLPNISYNPITNV